MTEVLMWHSKKPRRSQLRGFSMFARHGRTLTGESPEHAQIVGSV